MLDEEEPDRLTVVENKLRELKPLYKEAKSQGDKSALRELVPQLEELMAERRSLKGQTKPVQPSPDDDHAEDSQEVAAVEEMDDADVLFSQFFTIVNDLLGDELPEEAIETFLASDGFELLSKWEQTLHPLTMNVVVNFSRLSTNSLVTCQTLRFPRS